LFFVQVFFSSSKQPVIGNLKIKKRITKLKTQLNHDLILKGTKRYIDSAR